MRCLHSLYTSFPGKGEDNLAHSDPVSVSWKENPLNEESLSLLTSLSEYYDYHHHYYDNHYAAFSVRNRIPFVSFLLSSLSLSFLLKMMICLEECLRRKVDERRAERKGFHCFSLCLYFFSVLFTSFISFSSSSSSFCSSSFSFLIRSQKQEKNPLKFLIFSKDLSIFSCLFQSLKIRKIRFLIQGTHVNRETKVERLTRHFHWLERHESSVK